MKRLASENKSLEELLNEWDANNRVVKCNYEEAQVMIEFLLMHDTDFLVQPRNDGDDITIKGR